MQQRLPDLSLLPALDALLSEASVTRAAAALTMTPPAMSRTLGRLRRQLGDDLLVTSGRGLQTTPFAEALRPQVREALDAAVKVLRQTPQVLDEVVATHSIRSPEALATALMPELCLKAADEVPGLTLRMLPEGDEDPADLRRDVDLDLGVLGPLPPDVRSERLLDDHVVLMVRAGHPLTRGAVTPERLAATEQVMISRRGLTHGAIDVRLAELGLTRRVRLVTTSHAAAASVAASSDVAAVVAHRTATVLASQHGLRVLEVPLELPGIPIGMAWHVRLDADPVSRWVRTAVATRLREAPRQGAKAHGRTGSR